MLATHVTETALQVVMDLTMEILGFNGDIVDSNHVTPLAYVFCSAMSEFMFSNWF